MWCVHVCVWVCTLVAWHFLVMEEAEPTFCLKAYIKMRNLLRNNIRLICLSTRRIQNHIGIPCLSIQRVMISTSEGPTVQMPCENAVDLYPSVFDVRLVLCSCVYTTLSDSLSLFHTHTCTHSLSRTQTHTNAHTHTHTPWGTLKQLFSEQACSEMLVAALRGK
jgi:hypothetical protein